MYNRILISRNSSKCGELDICKRLAFAKALNAAVTFLYALEATTNFICDLNEAGFYALAKQSGEANLTLEMTMTEGANVIGKTVLAECTSPVAQEKSANA